MVNISPERTLRILRRLEDTAGVSVPLTITMATMMLLMDDVAQYTQLMERHAEVSEQKSTTQKFFSLYVSV